MQQACSSVSIPLGFHHPWRPASSQVAAGPLPSHQRGFASFLRTPMLGVCVHVCVSLVPSLSPVIQAGPPAMLSHDLIRRRGEAGRHHHQALPGSCHPSPASLAPVSGREMAGEPSSPPQPGATVLQHTPRPTALALGWVLGRWRGLSPHPTLETGRPPPGSPHNPVMLSGLRRPPHFISKEMGARAG